MAETANGKLSLTVEGLEGAIDAFGRLVDGLWQKSPALVWFCVIMVFLYLFYSAYCRQRGGEKEMDQKVLSKMPKKARRKKHMVGGRRDV